MKFDLVIRGGAIVTATDMFRADLGILDGKIASLASELPAGCAEREMDAAGKYVMPGGIDVHVHFQLPFCGTVSADDFLSGTRAAACGGVTTVIDFATQDRKKGLLAAIQARMEEARDEVCVDYSLHGVIIRWDEAMKREMDEVIAFGVPTFKMFMIYESEGWQADDAALFGALEATAENGARLMVHAESERVMNILIQRCLARKEELGAYAHALSRPNFIEAEAVQRAVKWAEATGGRLYIVHMSTAEAADITRDARIKGVNVLAETCPQYLMLDEELFKDPKRGHLWACCPQIKKARDRERLWGALANEELSLVATDTCTFDTRQKALWNGDFTKIPYGLPGVETMLPIIYTEGVLKKRFDMNHFVRMVSTNPAKIMGLFPQKGTLAPGSDADVIIVDPQKTRTVDYRKMETHCDWSPWQGMTLAGFPEVTISRGVVVVEDGAFTGRAGHGRFVRRRPGGDV